MADWVSKQESLPGALDSGALALYPRSVSDERRDALQATVTLGERAVRGGFLVWFLCAVLTHGMVFGWARVVLYLEEFVSSFREMRDAQREYFNAMYEIEVAREEAKKEPPPPEPEPEPEPEPAPAPKMVNLAPPKEEIYDTPPPPPAPAVAEAAKVLTTDEPVDLTGEGFVTGEGTVGYGQISAAGTGTVATKSPNAVIGGVVGGTGTAPGPPPPPPPPAVDRSKPPSLVGGTSWNCPFPEEANVEQIDEAVATIVVTVRPDGSPLSVKVLSDPGHGFGRQARMCALGRRFTPGLDRDGVTATAITPPIRVRFTR